VEFRRRARLGGLNIYGQLELDWLFDREIARFRAAQNFGPVAGRGRSRTNRAEARRLLTSFARHEHPFPRFRNPHPRHLYGPFFVVAIFVSSGHEAATHKLD
jgi:hypothetical protein